MIRLWKNLLYEESCRSLLRLLLGSRGHFPRLTSRLIITRMLWGIIRMPYGFFESWQNRLEKGILHESEDRLRSVGSTMDENGRPEDEQETAYVAVAPCHPRSQ